MDHDRLRVEIGGRVHRSGGRERPSLGRLVGLEPFVQSLVGYLEGPANGDPDVVRFSLPDRTEDLGQVVQRLQARLEAGPVALHVTGNVTRQLER